MNKDHVIGFLIAALLATVLTTQRAQADFSMLDSQRLNDLIAATKDVAKAIREQTKAKCTP